jgi:hypothetical protein
MNLRNLRVGFLKEAKNEGPCLQYLNQSSQESGQAADTRNDFESRAGCDLIERRTADDTEPIE